MCQAHVVADHKRVQSNGFDPQYGGAMTSMHKVYYKSRIKNVYLYWFNSWELIAISFSFEGLPFRQQMPISVLC